jgi:hypothetical protein
LYTYCEGNPLAYWDPTGHDIFGDAWNGVCKLSDNINNGLNKLTVNIYNGIDKLLTNNSPVYNYMIGDTAQGNKLLGEGLIGLCMGGEDYEAGIGTYESQAGHHLMAKSAFKDVNGYDLKKALTISNSKLAEFDVEHTTITGQQKKLYTAYSKTGKPLTMESMKEIEIKALTNSGIPLNYAKNWVEKAITELKKAGITNPSRIPWGK